MLCPSCRKETKDNRTTCEFCGAILPVQRPSARNTTVASPRTNSSTERRTYPNSQHFEQHTRPNNVASERYVPSPAPEATGIAIASMVCGIAGMPLSLMYGIGFFAGVAGLILSIVAGNRGNTSRMRTVGMILSIVSMVIGGLI